MASSTPASVSSDYAPPLSILDTDLYKLTMQQAVRQLYPDAQVVYRFTNRTAKDGRLFNKRSVDWIKARIAALSNLSLTSSEEHYLATLPFFKTDYVSWLAALRLEPDKEVVLRWQASATSKLGGSEEQVGDIEIEVRGSWERTILYEVPILSIVSEGYFKFTDSQWDFRGQTELAASKAEQMALAGVLFTEFGTRRRRSYVAQDIVIRSLIKGVERAQANGAKGLLTGTSNVHFAQKYGLKPIGTVAHEWIMGIAALEGYEDANAKAMDAWEKAYDESVGLAIFLPDTFSTQPFFRDFVRTPDRARRWKGLRQDSGVPKEFVDKAVKAWKEIGLSPEELKNRLIVFSDGLTADLCADLKEYCDKAGVSCSFGIGTSLVNDFVITEPKKGHVLPAEGTQAASLLDDVASGPVLEGETSKPLNIVMKLSEIDGKRCIKISDDMTKYTGDDGLIKEVRQRMGIKDSA